MKIMQTLKVKTKNGAKSKQALALKNFELIVGTGGMADANEYALYGIATDDPKTLNTFFTALLPFAQEDGIADTLDELAQFWECPNCILCLKKNDFDILEVEE